jgi:phage baseplate assembly protein W
VAEEPIYSDVDPDLRTDHGGNILVLEDLDAIDASVENILGISRGELVMHPEDGSNLETMVGSDNVDDNSAAMVRMIISDSLDQDPRVRIDKLTVDALPDDAAVKVLLEYTLNARNIRAEFERIVELG